LFLGWVLGEGEGLGEGLGEWLGEGLGDGDGLGIGDGDGLGIGDGEGEGLGEGLGEWLGEGLGDGEGEGPGEGLGDGLGEGLGDEPGEGPGEGLSPFKPPEIIKFLYETTVSKEVGSGTELQLFLHLFNHSIPEGESPLLLPHNDAITTTPVDFIIFTISDFAFSVNCCLPSK